MKARTIFFAFVVSACCGCGVLSSVEQISNATAGEQKKEALLNRRLEQFTKAIYWGSFEDAMIWVEPEFRGAYYRQAKERRRKERLVDLEVQQVEFGPDGDASVEIQVRYFSEPTYIVQKRIERQIWRFHRFDEGWALAESKTVDEGGKTDLSETAQSNEPKKSSSSAN